MKITSFIALCLFFVGVYSCGSGNQPQKEIQTYSFDPSSVILEWTAFKFTEKKGVKGTFNDVEIKADVSTGTADAVAKSLHFTLNPASVNTDNPERDAKISKLFFGALKGSKISGKILYFVSKDQAKIELTLNDQKQVITGKYLLEAGSFVLEAKIDVLNFGAEAGLKALNEACKELHTGADGVSKLWSEVDLLFSTELKPTSAK